MLATQPPQNALQGPLTIFLTLGFLFMVVTGYHWYRSNEENRTTASRSHHSGTVPAQPAPFHLRP